MFDPAETTFLESGCALIVGTTAPDGAPYATRAWGLTVLRVDGSSRVRLLLDLTDEHTIEHARTDGRIAITATAVPTLRSIQLKGRVVDITAASDGDRDRADQYCDAFFTDIVTTDGTPRMLTERLRPGDYLACTVAVDEMFDQTPGPAAGTRMGAGS